MVLASLLVFSAVSSASADDALTLRVRGRSQLKLRSLSRRADSKNSFWIQFSLQLTDGGGSDDREPSEDRSFADRSISVLLRGPSGPIFLPSKRTGDDGVVTFEQDGVPPASYLLTAEYRGDDLRDSVKEVFPIDVGRQPTQLRLLTPSRVLLGEELPIRLSLTSEGAPIEGIVELAIGRHHEQVTLSQGYGQLRRPGQKLGKSGEKLPLVARYAGTRQFSPSEAKEELLIASQAVVQLQLLTKGSSNELAQGSPLSTVGVVRDEEGPLAGELVELEALIDETGPSQETGNNKRSLGHAQTDGQGRFEVRVAKLMLPTGPALLSAHVFPRRGHIQPGRSPEVALQVNPPEPISVLYFLLPILVTVALWAGWATGRRLVGWLTEWLEERRQRRQTVKQAASAGEKSGTSHATLEPSVGEPGVKLTQHRRLATLRRAGDFAMDGQVVDAAFAVPVVATISLFLDGSTSGEPRHTIASESDGSFSTPPLAAGRYQCRLTAPGYLPQQFYATVPHKGEYRQIVARIEPLRARMLSEWRRVAEGLSGNKVATQTPRELLELLSTAKTRSVSEISRNRLTELTHLVEHAYYSPRVCTPEMLVSAAQLVDAILHSEKPPSAAKPTDLRAPEAPRPLIHQPRA